MLVPSLNTFVHFGADFDSDFEEEPALRKCKSEPNNRRWSKEGGIGTLPLDQMNTMGTLSNLEANAMHTLESLLSASNDRPELETMDKYTTFLMGSMGDKTRTIERRRYLSETMAEMLGNSEYERRLLEPVYVKNTFVHFAADSDSDFEEEASLRKCKSEPEERRRSKEGAKSTLQIHPMNAMNAQSIRKANAMQTLGSVELPPGVCNDHCKLKTWDKTRAIDSHQERSANMAEMLGKLKSFPSVRNNEYERELLEPVYVKSNFIDFDYMLDFDSVLPMRQTCSSHMGPAKSVSFDENCVLGEYGGRLLSPPARLRGVLRPTSDEHYAQTESSHKLINICDTTTAQGCLCHPILSTEQDVPGGMDDTASEQNVTGDSEQHGYEPRVVTTLMVCNLPCKLSTEGLTQTVDRLGFGGWYDLIYVPRGSKNFLGYGFINFIDAHVAARFSAIIGTYTFPGNSKKKAYCKVANYQGMKCNLKQIVRGHNYRKRAQVPVMY